MNSLKSTCVILVLAGVLYGVYVTLNGPEKSPSSSLSQQQLTEMQPPAIDFGQGAANGQPSLPPLIDSPPAASTIPVVDQQGIAPTRDIPAYYPAPERSVPPLVEPVEATIPETQPSGPAPFATEPSDPNAGSSTYTQPTYSQPIEPSQPQTAPATPTTAATTPALEAHKLKQAWLLVERHVQDNKFRDALAELSPFANNTYLTPAERQQVLTWLDALAGKVIYSNEHHFGEPHRVVGKTQTLYEVSSMYKVDAQLLMNINSAVVRDSAVLVPGTELKVIPGPFRAELSVAAGELTLFLGPLYAGRFSFTVGDEQPPAGTYQVREKSREKLYVGRDGRQLAANDPANPYGGWWLDLGNNVSLHGSPATAGGPALGCISFSPQDAQDLASILSVSSEVVIKP
ncbi:Putative L,D-transpeptidase YkuD [Anatilimnocola aggregata]|uniref:L,D-transpeptidase YkuD n=1 Tax=Anatilimnocola aggregata TaxID=2528021 RepID=A0A517Y5G2_9BACT|nr:L,D-transpeptidase [Anatilimnocola aggregata]QDU25478.1 Putative L,D-transpeptidase YkuD [Anatilimnocola aggregata]